MSWVGADAEMFTAALMSLDVYARAARRRALVDEHLVPVLPELAERLVVFARSDVWRVLGRLLLAFSSIETARDYQRALLGEARSKLLHPND